jgi:hypothetical protein
MKHIFLVLKNADFTEGRGPMLPHKAYATAEGARAYIKSQDGIYGTGQYEEPFNMFGGRYLGEKMTELRNGDEVLTSEMWNGYYIQLMDLED